MLMSVVQVCKRYIVLFISFIALTDQAEETMIFSKYAASTLPASRKLTMSSLLRLRQELSKLITHHTDKITDPAAKASALMELYDVLLQNLSVRGHQ